MSGNDMSGSDKLDALALERRHAIHRAYVDAYEQIAEALRLEEAVGMRVPEKVDVMTTVAGRIYGRMLSVRAVLVNQLQCTTCKGEGEIQITFPDAQAIADGYGGEWRPCAVCRGHGYDMRTLEART